METRTARMRLGLTFMRVLLVVLSGLFLVPLPAHAENISSEAIMKELKALIARVERLEAELITKDHEIKGVIEEREDAVGLIKAKEEIPETALDRLLKRISFGGLVEVGAVYDATDKNDGTREDSSDLNLTTVEIGIDVEVNDWVNLETVFLYEDAMGNTTDDESDVSLDVGTVTLGNPEKCTCHMGRS